MKRPALCLLLLLVASVARADFVEFQVPRTNLVLLLEVTKVGEAQAGRITPIQHRFGTLWIPSQYVRKKYKVPPARSLFNRNYTLYSSRQDPAKLMEWAKFALQRGMLPQFHKAIDRIVEVNPTHPGARRIVALREQLDKPCPDNPQLEQEMRKLVRKPDMKFLKSNHFLLLHDTRQTPSRRLSEDERRKWRPRSEERIELLERVYETFLYRFYASGVELEVPQDRLKVVLFNQHKDYLSFATRLGPEMSSTAGFWEMSSNTAVFFDQGTHEQFKMLRKIRDFYAELANRDKGLVRLRQTFDLLIRIEQESQDVEVVSHEATHQLAANTGLLPRYVSIPSWVHEGLATYFESPKDATWAGFGAVNEGRIRYYRVLANDRKHSNIDFIVGDQIFDYAGNTHTVLHGYAQAWALTHFLMEKHFDKFMNFYRKLGEMPPDTPLSADVLTAVFNDVFGTDRRNLDSEWRFYMNSLKTDKEKYLGDGD